MLQWWYYGGMWFSYTGDVIYVRNRPLESRHDDVIYDEDWHLSKSIDYGKTWSDITPPGVTAYFGGEFSISSDGRVVFMSGVADGEVTSTAWLSVDYGDTWKEVDLGVTWSSGQQVSAVATNKNGTLLLAGITETQHHGLETENGILFASKDFGDTFTTVEPFDQYSYAQGWGFVTLPDEKSGIRYACGDAFSQLYRYGKRAPTDLLSPYYNP
jgi:hypothetical protein